MVQTLLPCAPGIPAPPGGGNVQMALAMSIVCCELSLTLNGSLIADLPSGATEQGSYDFEVVPSASNSSVISASLNGNAVVAAYPGVVINLANSYTTYYILVVQH